MENEYSPTLKTYTRIIEGLKQEEQAFSVSYVVTTYKIKLPYARVILKKLLDEDKLEKIESSAGELYKWKGDPKDEQDNQGISAEKY